MYRKLSVKSPGKAAPEAVAFFVRSGQKNTATPDGVTTPDVNAAAVGAISRDEFTGEVGQVQSGYPEGATRRVFVIGLGDADPIEADAYRQAGAALLRAAEAARIKQLHLVVGAPKSGDLEEAAAARAVADGIAIANFSVDTSKGTAQAKGKGS
ncbi:MAG: hypothetical protein MI741_08000, partial [Rhodospirillales bacterium]|nr:hypothetical protein [Rhodospirillales bacterium]